MAFLPIFYGFRVNSPDAIDSRFVVADEAARLTIPSGAAYEGLITYAESEGSLWVLNDTDPSDADHWTRIDDSGLVFGSATGNIEEWARVGDTSTIQSAKIPNLDLGHLLQSGAIDGNIIRYNATSSTWEPAGEVTVDADGNITITDTEPEINLASDATGATDTAIAKFEFQAVDTSSVNKAFARIDASVVNRANQTTELKFGLRRGTNFDDAITINSANTTDYISLDQNVTAKGDLRADEGIYIGDTAETGRFKIETTTDAVAAGDVLEYDSTANAFIPKVLSGNVVANPTGTDGDDLTRLSIGGTNFNLSSAAGGVTITPLPSSGTATVENNELVWLSPSELYQNISGSTQTINHDDDSTDFVTTGVDPDWRRIGEDGSTIDINGTEVDDPNFRSTTGAGGITLTATGSNVDAVVADGSITTAKLEADERLSMDNIVNHIGSVDTLVTKMQFDTHVTDLPNAEGEYRFLKEDTATPGTYVPMVPGTDNLRDIKRVQIYHVDANSDDWENILSEGVEINSVLYLQNGTAVTYISVDNNDTDPLLRGWDATNNIFTWYINNSSGDFLYPHPDDLVTMPASGTWEVRFKPSAFDLIRGNNIVNETIHGDALTDGTISTDKYGDTSITVGKITRSTTDGDANSWATQYGGITQDANGRFRLSPAFVDNAESLAANLEYSPATAATTTAADATGNITVYDDRAGGDTNRLADGGAWGDIMRIDINTIDGTSAANGGSRSALVPLSLSSPGTIFEIRQYTSAANEASDTRAGYAVWRIDGAERTGTNDYITINVDEDPNSDEQGLFASSGTYDRDATITKVIFHGRDIARAGQNLLDRSVGPDKLSFDTTSLTFLGRYTSVHNDTDTVGSGDIYLSTATGSNLVPLAADANLSTVRRIRVAARDEDGTFHLEQLSQLRPGSLVQIVTNNGSGQVEAAWILGTGTPVVADSSNTPPHFYDILLPDAEIETVGAGFAQGSEVFLRARPANYVLVNGETDILDSTVGVEKIDATGTASATTYLRGDGSWTTVTGSGGGISDLVVLSGSNQDVVADGIAYISATEWYVNVSDSTQTDVTTSTTFTDTTIWRRLGEGGSGGSGFSVTDVNSGTHNIASGGLAWFNANRWYQNISTSTQSTSTADFTDTNVWRRYSDSAGTVQLQQEGANVSVSGSPAPAATINFTGGDAFAITVDDTDSSLQVVDINAVPDTQRDIWDFSFTGTRTNAVSSDGQTQLRVYLPESGQSIPGTGDQSYNFDINDSTTEGPFASETDYPAATDDAGTPDVEIGAGAVTVTTALQALAADITAVPDDNTEWTTNDNVKDVDDDNIGQTDELWLTFSGDTAMYVDDATAVRWRFLNFDSFGNLFVSSLDSGNTPSTAVQTTISGSTAEFFAFEGTNGNRDLANFMRDMMKDRWDGSGSLNTGMRARIQVDESAAGENDGIRVVTGDVIQHQGITGANPATVIIPFRQRSNGDDLRGHVATALHFERLLGQNGTRISGGAAVDWTDQVLPNVTISSKLRPGIKNSITGGAADATATTTFTPNGNGGTDSGFIRPIYSWGSTGSNYTNSYWWNGTHSCKYIDISLGTPLSSANIAILNGNATNNPNIEFEFNSPTLTLNSTTDRNNTNYSAPTNGGRYAGFVFADTYNPDAASETGTKITFTSPVGVDGNVHTYTYILDPLSSVTTVNRNLFLSDILSSNAALTTTNPTQLPYDTDNTDHTTVPIFAAAEVAKHGYEIVDIEQGVDMSGATNTPFTFRFQQIVPNYVRGDWTVSVEYVDDTVTLDSAAGDVAISPDITEDGVTISYPYHRFPGYNNYVVANGLDNYDYQFRDVNTRAQLTSLQIYGDNYTINGVPNAPREPIATRPTNVVYANGPQFTTVGGNPFSSTVPAGTWALAGENWFPLAGDSEDHYVIQTSVPDNWSDLLTAEHKLFMKPNNVTNNAGNTALVRYLDNYNATRYNVDHRRIVAYVDANNWAIWDLDHTHSQWGNDPTAIAMNSLQNQYPTLLAYQGVPSSSIEWRISFNQSTQLETAITQDAANPEQWYLSGNEYWQNLGSEYVDTSTAQTIAGNKTFTGSTVFDGNIRVENDDTLTVEGDTHLEGDVNLGQETSSVIRALGTWDGDSIYDEHKPGVVPQAPYSSGTGEVRDGNYEYISDLDRSATGYGNTANTQWQAGDGEAAGAIPQPSTWNFVTASTHPALVVRWANNNGYEFIVDPNDSDAATYVEWDGGNDRRIIAVNSDNTDHYGIYRVTGITKGNLVGSVSGINANAISFNLEYLGGEGTPGANMRFFFSIGGFDNRNVSITHTGKTIDTTQILHADGWANIQPDTLDTNSNAVAANKVLAASSTTEFKWVVDPTANTRYVYVRNNTTGAYLVNIQDIPNNTYYRGCVRTDLTDDNVFTIRRTVIASDGTATVTWASWDGTTPSFDTLAEVSALTYSANMPTT